MLNKLIAELGHVLDGNDSLDGKPSTRFSKALSPGGTPLHKPYRYVQPHRVGLLRRFGLKTGQHFAHFGLESGMVFEGTAIVYECIYGFNSKRVRTKRNMRIRDGFEYVFCCALI